MELNDVNGLLLSTSGQPNFTGYYLLINYDLIIDSENNAFQSQRVLTEHDGTFFFSIPQKRHLYENQVKVEVYAPNGAMLNRAFHTTKSLNACNKSDSDKRFNKPFKIEVAPLLVAEDSYFISDKNINGKVVDVLGGKISPGLQVLIWATKDAANSEFDQKTYTPIFIGKTDNGGYFGGKYLIDDYVHCFATINDAIDHPISVSIQEKKLTQFILLPFSQKNPSNTTHNDDDCNCHDHSSGSTNLESGNCSSDLGSECNIQFKPNRTLEEVSFCAITRTTDPQIQRRTINEPELYELKTDLNKVIESINESFTKLDMHVSKITADEALILALSKEVETKSQITQQ